MTGGAEDVYARLRAMNATYQDALLEAKYEWQREVASLQEQITAYEQRIAEIAGRFPGLTRLPDQKAAQSADASEAEREYRERAERLAAVLTEQVTARETALSRAKMEALSIVNQARDEARQIMGQARDEAAEHRQQEETRLVLFKTREQAAKDALLLVQQELSELIAELDAMDAYIVGKRDY